MRKVMITLGYSLLACLIIGVIFLNSTEIFAVFHQMKWWLIIFLILLQVPMIACGGLAFRILCLRFNIRLHWQDWVGLSFIANLINHLLPYRPGVGFRFLFLHQRYKMKIMDYIYVMLVYGLLMLLVSASFTLIGWCLTEVPESFNQIVFFSVLALLLIVSIILGLKLGIFENLPFLRKFNLMGLNSIQKALDAFKILTNNPLILFGTTLSLLAFNLLMAFIFYIIFIGAGTQLPFADCVFLVGIATIAMIFPITPGNIGVLETLIGTITEMMYQNFGIGFSVTALFRATQWIPSIILGTSFSFALIGSIIPSMKTLKLGANKRVD